MVIVLAAIILSIITSRNDDNEVYKNGKIINKSFVEETTFIERENIIKGLLADKYGVDKGVEVFIARESDSHINGVFFIENYNNEELFRGKFFAKADNSLDIIWSGGGQIECPAIVNNNFPVEMAPECF